MNGTEQENELVVAAIADILIDTGTPVEVPTEKVLVPAHQQEMPFALVHGQAYTKLPDDLYIPPDALEVFLEAFEGPLDFLLYLIRRQNLDILDIPVAEITRQYVHYVEMMQAINMELAGEYLVMAAVLGEIKSRMLLPRPKAEEGEEEEDPRAALIRRLQEYERFKKAAADLDAMPQEGRDFWPVKVAGPDYTREQPLPQVDLRELLLALQDVIRRADLFETHQISRETLSLREKMGQILAHLQNREFVPFVALFSLDEGRLGVVVTFIAILELVKEGIIDLVQTEAFGPVHVKTRAQGIEGEGYDLVSLDDDDSTGVYEAPPRDMAVDATADDLFDDDLSDDDLPGDAASSGADADEE